MLTDKDIDKLMKVFPTKDEVGKIVDEKLAPILEMNRQTLLAVEGIASRLDREDLTNAARDAQLTRHDGWIQHIAKETKVSLAD